MCIVLMTLLLVALGRHGVHGGGIRGLDPVHIKQYSGSSFSCLDGSKVVPRSCINDNYCDCADGSDEPGTSACYRGRFYCRNYGHEPQHLAAAFVDDGICDCCDGSDEQAGCANTCLGKSEAKRQALRDEAVEYTASLTKKAEYIERAKTKRSEWGSRLSTVESDMYQQRASVPALEAEISRLEAEKAEQAASDVAAHAAAEAAEAAAQSDDGDGAHVDPGLADGARADDAAGSVHEETDEERGRRIASQWTHDPQSALATEAAAVEDGGDTGAKHAVPLWKQHHDAVHHEGDDVFYAAADPLVERRLHADRSHSRGRRLWLVLQSAVQRGSATLAAVWSRGADGLARLPFNVTRFLPAQMGGYQYHAKKHRVSQTKKPSPVVRPMPPDPDAGTALGDARGRLAAAQARIAELDKERSALLRWLDPGVDYGPQDVWMAVAGSCFSDSSGGWTYQACLFDRGTQTDSGGNVVNIGMWRGFDAAYSHILFDQGTPCAPPAPPRSFKLTLYCGKEEALFEASEPTTCGYAASFTTPAACSEEEYQEILNELHALEEVEADVKRRIEEEQQEIELRQQEELILAARREQQASTTTTSSSTAPHEEL